MSVESESAQPDSGSSERGPTFTPRVDVLLPGEPALRVREWDPLRERALPARVFAEAADYIQLEQGRAPSEATVEHFFTGRAPHSSLADKYPLGILDADTGQPIGVLDLLRGYMEPDDLAIGLLMVVPSLRGSGVAQRAFDWLTGWAPSTGAQRLLIHVVAANPRGRAFWERQGFEPIATVRNHSSGERVHDLIRIVRPVSLG